jgi:hypothetical protein
MKVVHIQVKNEEKPEKYKEDNKITLHRDNPVSIFP